MSEAKWYILHTFSGYEKKVADNILKVVENRNLQHLIEEVMIPSETYTEMKEDNKGQLKPYQSKVFPCYVYVKMVMTDESWYICRNTRGCTGFVGPGSKPIPLTDEEVANLGIVKKQTEVVISVGDYVKIISGNLEGLEAVVNEIDEAAGKAVVTVSMFGRDTITNIDLSAIQKIN